MSSKDYELVILQIQAIILQSAIETASADVRGRLLDILDEINSLMIDRCLNKEETGAASR